MADIGLLTTGSLFLLFTHEKIQASLLATRSCWTPNDYGMHFYGIYEHAAIAGRKIVIKITKGVKNNTLRFNIFRISTLYFINGFNVLQCRLNVAVRCKSA